MRWAEHVARMGLGQDRRIQCFVRKPEGKRLSGRPRRRWERNIQMDVQEVGWETWIGLIWLRMGQLAGTCKSENEPLSSIKCREILDHLRTSLLLMG